MRRFSRKTRSKIKQYGFYILVIGGLIDSLLFVGYAVFYTLNRPTESFGDITSWVMGAIGGVSIVYLSRALSRKPF